MGSSPATPTRIKIRKYLFYSNLVQNQLFLAKDHRKRVLFVAHEEKIGKTIQEKLIRLKAFHKNLFIVDKLPGNLEGYDFLFIDSVNSHGLTPLEIEKLIGKYPKVSLAYVCQTTKDGNFRGSKEWEHMADVVVHAKNGVART